MTENMKSPCDIIKVNFTCLLDSFYMQRIAINSDY